MLKKNHSNVQYLHSSFHFNYEHKVFIKVYFYVIFTFHLGLIIISLSIHEIYK